MTKPRLKAWRSMRPASMPGGSPDDRFDHLRAARRPDADGHADLDRARPDRADIPVLLHVGADRIRGAEAIHRHREVRDHGDPVLHPRWKLSHPWRRRETHDRVRAN